jgi:teichuronic acid biosynthesis glycosyltransferase TuaC
MVPEGRADRTAPRSKPPPGWIATTLAGRMRALIVTNMYPTPLRPALGSFVRDQVLALQRIADVELELFAFDPGRASGYLEAAATLRRRYRHDRFDVIHAHFGLTTWPAFAVRGRSRAVTMHGTDLAHPRSRAITLAALRFVDLAGVVSERLAREVPRWAARGQVAVLPCGVDVERFRPIPRAQARVALGLDPEGPYLLFPADPRRPEKRHDRAVALAGDVPLLTLGEVDPERVPLWVNAANAVLVPSDREGFGLAVLEALACDVPVLATPTGIAPEALAGVTGAHCGPFEMRAWRDALAPHLAAADPRLEGRAHAEPFSSDRMAARLVAAWRRLEGPAGNASASS